LLFPAVTAVLSSSIVSREIRSDQPSANLAIPSYAVTVIRHLCFQIRQDGTQFSSYFSDAPTLTLLQAQLAKLGSDLQVPGVRAELLSNGFSDSEIDSILRRAGAHIKEISSCATHESLIAALTSMLHGLCRFRSAAGVTERHLTLASIARDFSAPSVQHRTLGARAFRRWRDKVVFPQDSFSPASLLVSLFFVCSSETVIDGIEEVVGAPSPYEAVMAVPSDNKGDLFFDLLVHLIGGEQELESVQVSKIDELISPISSQTVTGKQSNKVGNLFSAGKRNYSTRTTRSGYVMQIGNVKWQVYSMVELLNVLRALRE
jgi:hypothetical protein